MQERTRFFPLLVDEPAVAGLKQPLGGVSPPTVDIRQLKTDLIAIRNELVGVFEGPDTQRRLALESLEIGLTISAEGGVAFIAKASVEASITLTFTRNQSAKSG